MNLINYTFQYKEEPVNLINWTENLINLKTNSYLFIKFGRLAESCLEKLQGKENIAPN